MKKILFIWIVSFLAPILLQAQSAPLAVLPAPGEQAVGPTGPTLSSAERKKQFKMRRKQIHKLVKAYHKASPEEQPAIRAELTQLVGENTEAGLAYIKARLAAERANLDRWEAKIKQDEANIAQLNEKRVDELLAKDAKKKHKTRRKAWKEQLRQAKKSMR